MIFSDRSIPSQVTRHQEIGWGSTAKMAITTLSFIEPVGSFVWCHKEPLFVEALVPSQWRRASCKLPPDRMLMFDKSAILQIMYDKISDGK